MSVLYRRVAKLSINAADLSDLRVAFSIKKTLTKEPNTAEIRVWNLSAESRKAIADRHLPVILSAGYAESVGVVFRGDLRFVSHERVGPDWVTKLNCGDGEKSITGDRISRSFGPGTPASQVLLSVKAALNGVSAGNFDQAVAGITGVFENGVALAGDAFAQAEKIARGRGFTLSVQDGALSLIPENGAEAGTATLLTPETGLVGSPEIASPEKVGAPVKVKVKSLLQASLRPGRAVDLRSAAIAGLFRVDAVNHQGDTHGSDWFSDVELRRL